MGLFDNWRERRQERKDSRRDARLDRITARQDARTMRTSMRQETKQVGFTQGFDTTFGKGLSDSLQASAPIFQAFTGGGLGGLIGNQGTSGTITTGTDQSKGYTQILLALALGLFALFSFGGLFRKKKK